MSFNIDENSRYFGIGVAAGAAQEAAALLRALPPSKDGVCLLQFDPAVTAVDIEALQAACALPLCWADADRPPPAGKVTVLPPAPLAELFQGLEPAGVRAVGALLSAGGDVCFDGLRRLGAAGGLAIVHGLALEAFAAEPLLVRATYPEQIPALAERLQPASGGAAAARLAEVARMLHEKNAELEGLYRSLPFGLSVMDRDFRYLRVNAPLAAINGVSEPAHLGRRQEEVVPQIDPLLRERQRQVFATGEPALGLDISGRTAADPDRDHHWIVDLYPIKSGSTVHAIGTYVRDVTDQHRLRAELERSEARLRRVVDNVSIFIGLLTPDGLLKEVNATALARGGVAREEVIGRPFWQGAWWSHSRAAQDQLRSAVKWAASGESVRYDADVRVSDGSHIIVDFQLVPCFGADGAVVELVSSAMDITKRRDAEARKDMLLGELQHRVKNSLATTLSIVRFSAQAASSKEALLKNLEQRLGAIARTHDVLTESNWTGSGLRTLCDQEILPFTSERGPKYDYIGEDVVLSPKKALSFALAVHELTTNASKYGALSVSEGKVTLSVSRQKETGTVQFLWVETGGPPIPETDNRRQGFGSFLIRRVLSLELEADSDLVFASEGVRCTISFRA